MRTFAMRGTPRQNSALGFGQIPTSKSSADSAAQRLKTTGGWESPQSVVCPRSLVRIPLDLNWSTSIAERRLLRKLLATRGRQLRQVGYAELRSFFSRIFDRRADLGAPTSSPSFPIETSQRIYPPTKEVGIAWVAKSCPTLF